MAASLRQSTITENQYRPLDVSKSEIRLLSFENTSELGPIRLSLHYASLSDWKHEYVSFRDQNASTISSYQLSEAWSDRLDFTLATPRREIYDIAARFTWGDYICLSYTWGGRAGEKATVFLDGVATAVEKHLEAALRDLRESFECRLGMKVWVDALCINQADIIDRNTHISHMKDIFGGAFAVTVWTKQQEDLQVLGLSPPGEQLLLCEVVLREYGRRALEELLGVQERDWGEANDEDERLMDLVEDTDVLVFNQYHWADSDDEDEFGFGKPHLRDIVLVELMLLFRKEYWSRLWIIQELAVSPTTSVVHWGESTFHLSTLQAVGEILLSYSKSEQPSDSENWRELKPRLDLLAFISTWRALEIAPDDDTGRSLNDASIRQLKLLAQHATCSLPHDKVYALLGLLPPSVSSAVTIDYSREPADVIAEFSSAVPGWAHQP
ncbi:heterokaryon incompatibility protein-domain-containing protein [Durotheca rogersii]|uniref:heterokaryon incompatibility protein-domain-containing protein n=1 Tax=Durotheca rogersii TaxID=419775 RepID=UPI00221EDD8B|nr:heterokaryon incompatibility protein-domain-containing protein [Durotheca rogersii]KAI5864418.1 heterokaryon incompatibility protein-domain-containing protein [Durotheca rogersii]